MEQDKIISCHPLVYNTFGNESQNDMFMFQHFVTLVTCIHFLICNSPQMLILTERFPTFYHWIIFSFLTVVTCFFWFILSWFLTSWPAAQTTFEFSSSSLSLDNALGTLHMIPTPSIKLFGFLNPFWIENIFSHPAILHTPKL